MLTTGRWAARTLRLDLPGADRQALHDTVGLEPTAGRDCNTEKTEIQTQTGGGKHGEQRLPEASTHHGHI